MQDLKQIKLKIHHQAHSVVDWNMVDLVDENKQNEPSIFMAIRGEFESLESEERFKALLKTRKIIGLCSYQTFPRLICNPYQNQTYPRRTEDLFLQKYGDQVILWCHCFKDPMNYIPDSIPQLLYSETDQYAHIKNLLAINNPNEKEYDCFVSMPEGEWNAWIRGLHILQRWLNYMADEMGLRILVCGNKRGGGDFSSKIKVIGFQPWNLFLQEMSKAKFLLNAARHDASPRIILEAIGLNMPVLLNEHIVGGWKYINKYTGDFFFPDEEVGPKIRNFMERLPTFKPRLWLQQNFNVERNKETLTECLQILQSFKFEEVIDAILFINLEASKDRLHHMLTEFARMQIPATLYERIEASYHEHCGHLGCTFSHIKALKRALQHPTWERVLILEDDFQFTLPKERILYMLNEFLARTKKDDWDVLMFTTYWKEYKNETDPSFIKVLNYGTTAAGYLVNGKAAMQLLLTNFEESKRFLEIEVAEKIKMKMKMGNDGRFRINETIYALDMYWRDLQRKSSRFYITEPHFGKQAVNMPSTIML